MQVNKTNFAKTRELLKVATKTKTTTTTTTTATADAATTTESRVAAGLAVGCGNTLRRVSFI